MTAWGVLGTASIALEHVVPAIREAGGRLRALGSRDPARARHHGRALGFERAYGDYRHVLDDDEVDAVYVPLPNSLHHGWAKEALDHGKHVLVEKPSVLSSDHAVDLVATARDRGLLLVEGTMFRFHEQWRFLRDWAEDALHAGAPAVLRVHIGFRLEEQSDPDDIRLRPELGGGAFRDLGTYAVAAASALFGEAVDAVFTRSADARGVDRFAAGCLVFDHDRAAVFDCDFRTDWVNTPVELRTARATAVLEHAFNPGGSPTEALVLRQGAPPESHAFAGQNAYTRMITEIHRHVAAGARSRFAHGEAEALLLSARNADLLVARVPAGAGAQRRS
ncbi:Gfo/Idh/MocA family oxidoreductase [Actinosynnema sp. NPDC050436]|uniref:Gfo/Idh/MocA family protein n=1 Tax=Actinosynnema sp. NPDC050436 TaxID=3155659 RepID=UPI00340D377E